MGSTGLTLINRLLRRVGGSELSGAPDFSLLSGENKLLLDYINQGVLDLCSQLEFPELITDATLSLTSGQERVSLPSDIFSKKVKYVYTVDLDRKNRGIIPKITKRDFRVYNYRAASPSFVKCYWDDSYLYFTSEITDSNKMLSPKSYVNAASASGAKYLYVADAADFTAGQTIIVGEGTAREEYGTVSSTSTTAPEYLLLEDNLTYTHTIAQADVVDGTYRMKMTYMKTPTTIDAYNDTIEIPTIFDQLIEYAALQYYFLYTGQAGLYGPIKGLLDSKIKEAKLLIRKNDVISTWHQSEEYWYTGAW